ncbi:MAG TPA: heme-binding protein [Nitrospira sp.]|nr:heme-binding protein [Nitrospira sp.]
MKRLERILFLAMVATVSWPAWTFAQSVADSRSLTLEGAKSVIAAAVSEAKRLKAPGGSIAVVDDGGNLLALMRLDHTFAASANIAIGKARTAALFKKPTSVFEESIKGGRTSMVALGGDLQNFTPLQGGLPLEWEGRVVGAIGVSGAASAQQDEELALAGAHALGAMDVAGLPNGHAPLPVTYIGSETVAASFAKGAVLIGEDEQMMHAGRNYMVHASHREQPGVVEIHEEDTDIVYVLQGSAQLVTGGTPVGAKTIAPHELRAPTVEGGESRRLVPGDIVVIPNGVPHWFKAVDAPFNYYVVKVK